MGENMAQIDLNNFQKKLKERNSIQEKINASYSAFDINGKRYFQIDTYGSFDRQISGKVSQTIQFDKDVAFKIIELLKSEFNI